MPRLDILVTRSGLAESRERAQTLIIAGKVRVAGETVRRPDRSVSDDAAISVEEGPSYASRGALKLAPALMKYATDPEISKVIAQFVSMSVPDSVVWLRANIDEIERGLAS